VVKAFPVADAHCDFLYEMLHKGYDLKAPADTQQVRLSSLICGGVKLQFFAAWVDKRLKDGYLDQALKLIDAYYRMLKTVKELAPFDGLGTDESKIYTVLSIEGGEAIEDKLENLRIFHKLGVRAMTLTWNYKNGIAYPAMGRTQKGLTKFGKEVVQEMGRIGMAVDVSHLNDAGFEDVLAYSVRPVMASHSNARNVFWNPRNLTDEQITLLAKHGGFIGVNLFQPQLCYGPECTITDVVRHIDHIAGVGGIDCVGLGSDFDGMANAAPEGLFDSSGFPSLFEALLKLGYSGDDIYKISYGNLARYIADFYGDNNP
jgi:membrane dipeptidase